MPMVLKELTRFRSVLTTDEYYVGIQAEQIGTHLKSATPDELNRQQINSEVNDPMIQQAPIEFTSKTLPRAGLEPARSDRNPRF